MHSPFVNIHTHRKPQSENEICIRNCPIRSNSVHVKSLNYSLSAGIHPWYTDNFSAKTEKILLDTIKQKHVIAIGECGLDRLKGAEIDIQIDIFKKHIQWAKDFQKPLIIHCVKAYSDILSLLKTSHLPFIMHGFKGNAYEASQLIEKGAYLSFGHRILNDQVLQDILKNLPLNRIFLETDSKPLQIEYIYQRSSDIMQIEMLELKQQIFENYKTIFPND